jgi:hypothetical protein
MNTHEFEDRLEALRPRVHRYCAHDGIGGLLAELRLRPNIVEAPSSSTCCRRRFACSAASSRVWLDPASGARWRTGCRTTRRPALYAGRRLRLS